jgi:hypothetical protein
MTTRRTPIATAKLLLINAKLYERERDRDITRYRFSIPTLRTISGRLALRESFLSDLDNELADLGWLFIRLGAEFAIMNLAKTDSWVKLGSNRLSKMGHLEEDEEEIDDAYLDCFPSVTEIPADE